MIAVLLVTHGRMGQDLVNTSTHMLGGLSLRTAVIEVRRDDDPDERVRATQAQSIELDDGDGVLLLTDAFGSTPSNVANRAVENTRHRVVAGLNLPMLVRIYNYPDLKLEEMAASAVEGGRLGVMACTSPPQSVRK